jgi:thioredoxin reductase (NADPH)
MDIYEYDVLVVGGGPAGLSAALYLARYDRSVALFDAGHGRSTWHQMNYNYLGFPGGISARELRERGYQQLAEYPQVTVLKHKIASLQRANGLLYASTQSDRWCGRAVILCTGVIDHYPHFEHWEEYVGRSMFWCITCDGYGCKEARVVVLGCTNAAAAVAMQLRRFTDHVTVLTNSDRCEIADSFRQRLHTAQVPLLEDKISAVEGSEGMVRALVLRSGATLEVEQLFSQQGATPQVDLAKQVGVLLSEGGYIHVDSEQHTNVAGVYAAGDVTRAYAHQITAAVHEGATAASAANYFLYPPELKDS